MKQFLQRGETYSFFNPRNIAAGALSIILAALSSLIVGYTFRELFSMLIVPLVVFLFPTLFMGKKHGWKSGLSTFTFGLLVFIPAMIWFVNALFDSIFFF